VKNNILLISFLLFFVLGSMGQEQVNFHGKVLSSNGFVFNATIINKKTRKGTVSRIDGDFSLYVVANDTISFSCIGYKPFTHIIPSSLGNTDYRVLISMIEDTVMLKETIITPWPINTTALKRAFLADQDKEKEIIASYAGFREIDGPQREPPPTIFNPISFIANIFSKKRIQQKKMEKFRRMLQQE
jgi:hypothetical protein